MSNIRDTCVQESLPWIERPCVETKGTNWIQSASMTSQHFNNPGGRETRGISHTVLSDQELTDDASQGRLQEVVK